MGATTLGAAVHTTDENKILLASVTDITAGSTMLRVDAEAMAVLKIEGLMVHVLRGVAGTKTATHDNAAIVYFGMPSDFELPELKDLVIYASGTGTAGALTAGYIKVLIDGDIRYIPLAASI
jgi:hypothetical protein